MGRLICISLLLLALYSSIVQPANGCACKRQIIRDQVCRADFVGVVELLSQAHDASLNASRYKGNYVDTFRANFIIDDLSTTIWARQLICGHQRMNLDFDQSQTANRNNTYFLIA
uniref:NTR domain-containing protein n=1 Tax=Plectus sambesii TaxID=2011161 RepID=A0A914VXE1_9BILA